MELQNSLSPSPTIPAVFYSQKLWGLGFLAMELWAGGPDVGLGYLPPQGEFL